MFIRRKHNKTGTTSVQVIDKSHKSYRVVKSFGAGGSELAFAMTSAISTD